MVVYFNYKQSNENTNNCKKQEENLLNNYNLNYFDNTLKSNITTATITSSSSSISSPSSSSTLTSSSNFFTNSGKSNENGFTTFNGGTEKNNIGSLWKNWKSDNDNTLIMNDNNTNSNNANKINWQDTNNDDVNYIPIVKLIQQPNSHPFFERTLKLNTAFKIGRAVAKSKPNNENAIFDCKVLSRNHALIWYENGKFYLKDTQSSNGTFVNGHRLSLANEDSSPREIFSGEIVQFGVDVVENPKKVTHGCILAKLLLYHADGSEASLNTDYSLYGHYTNLSGSSITSPSSSTSQSHAGHIATISVHNLYLISQSLKEAFHREELLKNKLTTLQTSLSTTQKISESSWKSLVEEDRLISRIESLENRLETVLNLNKQITNNNKNKLNEKIKFNNNSIIKKLIKPDVDDNIEKENLKNLNDEKNINDHENGNDNNYAENEDDDKEKEEIGNQIKDIYLEELMKLHNDKEEYEELAKKKLNKIIEEKINLLSTISRFEIESNTKDNELKRLTEYGEDLEKALSSLNDKQEQNAKDIDELQTKLKDCEEKIITLTENLMQDKNKYELKINEYENRENELQIIIDNLNQVNEKLNDEINLLRSELLKRKDSDGDISIKNEENISDDKIKLKSRLNNLETKLLYNLSIIDPDYELTTNNSKTNSNNNFLVNGVSKEEDIESFDNSVIPNTTSSSIVLSHSPSTLTTVNQLEKVNLNKSSHLNESDIETLKQLLEETRLTQFKLEEKFKTQENDYENKIKSIEKDFNLKCQDLLISQQKLNDFEDKLKNVNNDYDQLNNQYIECKRIVRQQEDEIESLKIILKEENEKQQNKLIENEVQIKSSSLLNKCLIVSSPSISSNTNDTLLNINDKKINEKLLEKIDDQEMYQSEINSCDLNPNDNDYGQCICQNNSDDDKDIDKITIENLKIQVNDLSDQLLEKQTKFSEMTGEIDNVLKEKAETLKERMQLIEEIKMRKEEYDLLAYQNKMASACAILPLLILLLAFVFAYYPSISLFTGTLES